MNLSKFYKKSNSFQKEKILPRTTDGKNEAVWGSIVVQDATIVEPETPQINTVDPFEDPMVPDIEEPQFTENLPPISETVPIEEPAPVVEQPKKVPEPAIDIAAIEQKSFDSGVAAGKQQAEDDFENSAQTLLNMCKELDILRETILRNSTDEMKKLILDISTKIIRHSVTEQEETIVATIKDSISRAVKSDEFQIQLNPEDLAIVETRKQEIIDTVSGLDTISLKPDATIERGGCTIESSYCTLDATISSQIGIIHDSVMGPENGQDFTEPPLSE